MSRLSRAAGLTKTAAKYVVAEMPMRILGFSHLRQGNQQIREMWQSLTKMRCPECDIGVMDIHEVSGHEAAWHCSSCPFEIVSGADKATAELDFSAHRAARLQEVASTLDAGKRRALSRGHVLHSRTFYAASAVVFLGALYMIVEGGFVSGLGWLTMSSYFFVKGLQKAYRCWQVEQGVLFQPGSFQQWWKGGKWFV